MRTILLCLAASPGWADYPDVARIEVRAEECHGETRNTVIHTGTVFPVHNAADGRTSWLTANHLFEASSKEAEEFTLKRVTIFHRGRKLYPTHFIRNRDGADVRLLKTKETVPAYRVSTRSVQVGDAVELVGYPSGSNGQRRRLEGRVREAAGTFLGNNASTFTYTCDGSSGYSGGPVFYRGEVVGVHWGARDGKSFAAAEHEWLTRVLKPAPESDEQIAVRRPLRRSRTLSVVPPVADTRWPSDRLSETGS